MSKKTAILRATVTTMSGLISKRYNDSTGYGMRYAGEARRLDNSLNALFSMYSAKRPTETDAYHFRKVSVSANKLKLDAQKAEQRIFQNHRDYLNDIDARINERLGFQKNEYAAELRSAIRSAKDGEKYAIINGILAAGDGQSMAAILDAPPVIMGITKEVQDKYRESYLQTHAADLLQEQKDVQNTVSEMATLVGKAIEAASSMVDAETLADIERGEQAANDAESQFKTAIQ